MEDNSIRDYIMQHKESYSKEQIIAQLKNSGVSDEQINKVYSVIDVSSMPQTVQQNPNTEEKPKKKSSAGIIIAIIILLIIGGGIYV
jgi:SOS response regulatory protein OraA/RecX